MSYRFWTDDPACFAAAFSEHMSSSMIQELHEAVRAHRPPSAGPRTLVGLVHEGMVASRRALSGIGRLIADPEIPMDGFVCCIDGTGFWAATGRGMATSVLTVARATAPVKVTSTLEEAERWLEVRGLPAPRAEVQREMRALRAS